MPSQEVVADRIHKKFPETKGEKISYRILDDGNIELKIGEQIGIGSKQRFSSFCTQSSTNKSFGEIDFVDHDTLLKNLSHKKQKNEKEEIINGHKISFESYTNEEG